MSAWIADGRRFAIYERDGWKCVYCGRSCFDIRTHPERFVSDGYDAFVFLDADDEHATLDHVKPRCKGGGHENDNLVLSCIGCNSTKGGR